MSQSQHPHDDVWDTMRTARAIRRFRNEPVDDTVLAQCLQAATWAPSGGNQQPWRFVVLRSTEAREAMAIGAARALETIQNVYHLDRPDAQDTSPRARSTRAMFDLHDHARDVPTAVLFCVHPQPATPALLEGASIYPAMQNFLLAARASGLGACVTGWHVDAESEFRKVIGVPDDWKLAALVVVGWPMGRHGPVRRHPIAEVAALDRWDQPHPESVVGDRPPASRTVTGDRGMR
jgi:nitroreductase